ncbi:alanyl-tRNA editing protein [Aggregatilinea lenta]|uniref:alanyl-tRNA editing protein n=1 Tax=Aggregatilinea lenta TaxID=913108 RepID=UPI0013C346A9|nr:DHHA1 domain-containing protein [Aggregatilinea lenta]
MTQRLYYTDSYTVSFHAAVIERTSLDGISAVVLDQSYFYPTSGGQPHDTGQIDGVPVVDVAIRESDGAVLHVLDGDLPLGPVHAQIDWARRFDHMQHHTGQHILSQAFIELLEAETIGFHLSADSVTIDLNILPPDAAQTAAVEGRAYAIVAENRPVRVLFPAEDEIPALGLRKIPPVEGRLRVVDIGGYDRTACGGTHVAHSAEVGLIKILRIDRRGDTSRVEFRCGQRALLDYRQKNALMNQLAADLTVGFWEVPAAVERLRAEAQDLRREVRALRAAALETDAAASWQAAERRDGYTLVVKAFEDRDAAEVRQFTQMVVGHPATVALCGVAGDKAQLIAARSDDLPFDMVPVLKRGLAIWGVDRGGGRPSFAQGGGASASLADVENALKSALQALQ